MDRRIIWSKGPKMTGKKFSIIGIKEINQSHTAGNYSTINIDNLSKLKCVLQSPVINQYVFQIDKIGLNIQIE